MPLKLADINHPASTNILNAWADDKDNIVTAHTQQLQQIFAQFQDLLKKNPTLVKPNGVK